ncbi:unnamed protein product, partial [Brenthis ino]
MKQSDNRSLRLVPSSVRALRPPRRAASSVSYPDWILGRRRLHNNWIMTYAETSVSDLAVASRSMQRSTSC